MPVHGAHPKEVGNWKVNYRACSLYVFILQGSVVKPILVENLQQFYFENKLVELQSNISTQSENSNSELVT